MSNSSSKERRQFMAAMGGLIAGATLPPGSAQAAALPPRTPLSRLPGKLNGRYGVVVIGSVEGDAPRKNWFKLSSAKARQRLAVAGACPCFR